MRFVADAPVGVGGPAPGVDAEVPSMKVGAGRFLLLLLLLLLLRERPDS